LKHYPQVDEYIGMQKCKSTGLSLPTELMLKIDRERGDIPRSRFLLRLVEQAYKEKEGGLDLNE
jgi:hypothetical protein